MIAADGSISSEEAQNFMTMVSRAKIVSSITYNQWRDIMNKISKLMKKGGAEAIVNLSVQNISDNMKVGVFCYACELAFVDGYADEQKILDIVKKELNMEDDLAYKVA